MLFYIRTIVVYYLPCQKHSCSLAANGAASYQPGMYVQVILYGEVFLEKLLPCRIAPYEHPIHFVLVFFFCCIIRVQCVLGFHEEILPVVGISASLTSFLSPQKLIITAGGYTICYRRKTAVILIHEKMREKKIA